MIWDASQRRHSQAIAKFLFAPLIPNNEESRIALNVLTKVTITKPKGTMSSSANLAGLREKATLENKRAGVKNDTLSCGREKELRKKCGKVFEYTVQGYRKSRESARLTLLIFCRRFNSRGEVESQGSNVKGTTQMSEIKLWHRTQSRKGQASLVQQRSPRGLLDAISRGSSIYENCELNLSKIYEHIH